MEDLDNGPLTSREIKGFFRQNSAEHQDIKDVAKEAARLAAETKETVFDRLGVLERWRARVEGALYLLGFVVGGGGLSGIILLLTR